MSVVVRTTLLQVSITPPPTEAVPDPVPVLDPSCYAASCSFGFDQRYAEATIRRTGGGTVEIGYWSGVEVRIGCLPGTGAGVGGAPLRFVGYVVPIDNQLFPIENVLACKGTLYRAAFVRNQTSGGTVLAEVPTGASDEAQVQAILTACGVPFTPANIGGTGKALGSIAFDFSNPVVPGPFTWAKGQSGLDYIEALDAVSVPDDATGRYRTFESLAGEVYRIPLVTAPASAADFSFEEGVDVFDARITRDPSAAANVVEVTGMPTPITGAVAGVEDLDVYRFTAGTADAPYLPPGLPVGAGGFPAVTATFASPLIEKAEIADPGDVVACEAVAAFLLGESNTVLDTLEFSTPRDDLLGPGQTVHLTSARLGLTDPTRHYWVQHLEVVFDERGAVTQRLRCLRRS